MHFTGDNCIHCIYGNFSTTCNVYTFPNVGILVYGLLSQNTKIKIGYVRHPVYPFFSYHTFNTLAELCTRRTTYTPFLSMYAYTIP